MWRRGLGAKTFWTFLYVVKLYKIVKSKMSLITFPYTCVSWAWLTWGSRRGVELVASSVNPPGVDPVCVGASPLVDAPGATVGPKVPEEATSSSVRTVPSLSLDKRSWITGSPRRMWQRMANMDSAILPPYTFSGFLFHKLLMQLNAAWTMMETWIQNLMALISLWTNRDRAEIHLPSGWLWGT